MSTGSTTSVTLQKAYYVPKLGCNLFSLRAATALGNTFEGTIDEIILRVKSGGTLRFPSCQNIDCLEAIRVVSPDEMAAAVRFPVKDVVSVRPCSITSFHTAYRHLKEALLRKTVASMGITLTGTLEPCSGCSHAKAFKQAIPSYTKVRATKRLARIFGDLSDSKPVLSLGGQN